MSSHIEATFAIDSWDETPFAGGRDNPKLTEALVRKTYSGDIDGSSTTKWLMAYAPDKTATFVGIERITGMISGREGDLVLLHDGEFSDGVASANLRVALGTGDLTGTAGTGKFRADPSGSVSIELEGV
jgi:hypothetical protein